MITSSILFIVGCLLLILGMAVYGIIRTGSLSNLIEQLRLNNAAGDWKIVFTIVIVLILAMGVAYDAMADEPDVGWFEYTEIYVGTDYTYDRQSVFCVGGQIDDRLTGQGTVTQQIMRYNDFETVLRYTHHSCAVNGDAASYDALGLGFKLRFTWR